jgi:hypothetical protein
MAAIMSESLISAIGSRPFFFSVDSFTSSMPARMIFTFSLLAMFSLS